MAAWSYPRRAVHDSIANGTFEAFLTDYTPEEVVLPSRVGFSIATDASLTRDPAALAALRRHGVVLDVFGATAWGLVDEVESLVRANPARMVEELWLGTPMDWALELGHVAVADLLLRLGYSRPIHLRGVHEEALRWAVDHGAAVDESRPLHHQAKHGRTRSVEVLLELGADVNLADDAGETPLHLLARRGSGRELAEILLRHGADLTATNAAGDTPVDVAARAKNPSLAGFFDSL